MTQDEDTLTTQEVARLLNVTDRTVINMAERGDLPGRTIARGKQRLWRFTRHDVDAFLATQQCAIHLVQPSRGAGRSTGVCPRRARSGMSPAAFRTR